ncbi:MAG: hypothetical protein DMG06_27815 [Acidobacteria bacterium]|nr:MAG: hypothetical protein DMG06_27815 [Acidobacteriota bacterium]
MRYTFEWDPNKAKENLQKHKVSFERAAEVFRDPLAISIFDDEHSEHEERWVTIGRDSRESVLVLVHTFSQTTAQGYTIRIISARKAKKKEASQYEEI